MKAKIKGTMLFLCALMSASLLITTHRLFWRTSSKESQLAAPLDRQDSWRSNLPLKSSSSVRNTLGIVGKNHESVKIDMKPPDNTKYAKGDATKNMSWNSFLKQCSNSSASEDVHKSAVRNDCNDQLCTNFLSKSDLNIFRQCQKNSTRRFKRFLGHQESIDMRRQLDACLNRTGSGGVLATGDCRFMKGEGRDVVGLVSFPGSGNTWVRGLLQSATGICTGAVFCDATLRLGGFDGEGLQTSSVLVVKTHSAVPAWRVVEKERHFKKEKNRVFYDSVILLIRNPFHALVSEWNRLLSTKYNRAQQTSLSHVETHGPEYFLQNGNWTDFVQRQIRRWKKTFDWASTGSIARDAINSDNAINSGNPINSNDASGGNVLIVRYEDVLSGAELQVKRMLDFLHFEITGTNLSTRLRSGVQLFWRPKGAEFDHFTLEQRELVNSNIESVRTMLFARSGRTFSLDEYVWTSS